MADEYYVLETDGVNTQVVIRIDTPPGSNTAGTPWSQVLSERWDNLDAQERVTQFPGKNVNQLSNGAQHEIRFGFAANVNRPGIVTELEAAVAAEIMAIKTQVQARYDYWGKEG
jgi:hypothetical protein